VTSVNIFVAEWILVRVKQKNNDARTDSLNLILPPAFVLVALQ
jgi:hypothetical protein